MADKRKKRRKPSGRIFYPVYWSLVVIGIALIGLMMRMLWDSMADYEASMPKYVAREAEKIFAERDFSTMYDYDDTTLFASEGREAYIEYMDRLTQGQEIVSREAFSANPDEKVYKLTVGGKKLGTYTLSKSGEKSGHGNDLWMLKEIRTSVIQPTDYLITVPESALAYADGQLLDSASAVESGLELTEGYLPEGLEEGKWCTYSVTRCFSVPKFSVQDRQGRDMKLAPNQEGRLTAQVNYDDEQMKPIAEERVIKIARAFSQFTSDDLSVNTMMDYIMDDTKAEQYIKSFDGGWFYQHRSVEYENMRTEKYVSYDENTFSCNVYFDYIINYKKTTEVYPTGYTLFLKKQGEQWLLFDFTTISV